MIAFAIAFTIGISILMMQSELPPVELAVVGLFALPLFLIRSRLSFFIVGLAISFSWSLIYSHHLLEKQLPESLESRDLKLSGVVAAMPEQQGTTTRFLFDIDKIESIEQTDPIAIKLPLRVRLSWFYAPSINAGERWQVTARLKRPNGFMNPGGFDYESWLFQQGIRATGYVKKDEENFKLADAEWGVERTRQMIRDQMRASVPDSKQTPVLIALAIGDQRGIDEDAWQVFTRTGTNHLVAVSGMHITLVAGFAFFIFRWCWARFGRLPLMLPAPKAAAILCLIPAIAYAALAGFSVPTQRALIMTTVVMLSLYISRKHRPFSVLVVAWILVLLYDPFAILSAGFWLSFVAVSVIFYAMLARRSQRGWWWRYGHAQWVVALGLMPVMIILFQQVPLLSPVANLIAIPWVTFVVTPLALLGACLILIAPPVASVFLFIAANAMDGIWLLLQFIANRDEWIWHQAIPARWTLIFAVVGVVWWLLPRGVPARWLGGVMCLPMLLVKPSAPNQGEVWVTVLDVGEGLSTVVRTQNHVMVYDTGPRFSDRFDTGEAVVVPYMRYLGVSQLDVLMVSHGDLDHRGGAESILNEIPVREFVSSIPQELPRAADRPCVAGANWQWDGVLIEVLHPNADDEGKDNNLSCVVRVSTGSSAFLLTGDIEKQAERKLIERYGASVAADVMLVPHHGSKTSSQDEFIEAVSPLAAVAATGYRNRFGFPKSDVVDRYIRHGISFYNTAATGALTFRLNQQRGFVVEAFRQDARRFWHSMSSQGRV